MKARALLFVSMAWLCGCAPDYIDLGYDRATGGTGGGNDGPACLAGETRECYSGPAGTAGQGKCQAGQQTCNTAGTSFGPCEGEVTPTPEECVAPGDENCDGTELVCDGHAMWGYRVGDQFAQSATSVGVNSAGTVVLAGHFFGVMDFGGGLPTLVAAGGLYGFVAKVAEDGKPSWAVRLGGVDTLDIDARAVVDNDGDVIVSGYFGGTLDVGNGEPPLESAGLRDVFVTKLDAGGTPLWLRRFGDSHNQQALSVTTDGQGNIVLAGVFAGALDFGAGSPLASVGDSDLFVAKLDPSGTVLWAHAFGDSQCARVSAAADVAGNVALAGQFGGVLDLGSGLSLASNGNGDAFVAKLDPAGTPLWAHRFGDSQAQGCEAVAVDGAGNIVLAGDFEGVLDLPDENAPLTSAGSSDVFVAKLDAAGTPLWARRFGNDELQRAAGIAVDSASYVVVGGQFYGTIEPGGGEAPLTSAGDSDVFVLKLDASGAPVWARRFGDHEAQECVGVAVGPAGDITFGGDFVGTIEPGNGEAPLTCAGNSDVFAVQLGP